MKQLFRPLQVEVLESRTLLSTTHLGNPGAAASLVGRQATPQPAALSGALHGSYATSRPVLGDAGAVTSLRGSGKVRPLGQVTTHGSLHATGFIQDGQAGGSLTLANAAGTLVLQLDGPPQGGFAPLPAHFDYVVQQGTGAFQGLAAHGTADLSLRGRHARGRFTLTLHPGTDQTPPPTIATGIRGIALEGPITPVSRPGVPNERPLPNAILSVQAAGGGPEIARQQADSQGMFQIALTPGSYRIVPLPPEPNRVFPSGVPQDVTISQDQVLDLTVHYDTGIR